MKPDRKQVASKLDPFAAQLLALNDAGKKLPEIQQWLESEKGMKASISCISNYLTKLRTARGRKAKENEARSISYWPELKEELELMREAAQRRQPRKRRGAN